MALYGFPRDPVLALAASAVAEASRIVAPATLGSTQLCCPTGCADGTCVVYTTVFFGCLAFGSAVLLLRPLHSVLPRRN